MEATMTYVAYTKKHAGKRNGMFLRLLLGIVGLLPASASAQTQNFIFNSTFPVVTTEIVPCTGDIVELTGDIHDLLVLTFNENGGFHVKEQFNAQGLSGVDII